MTSMLTITEAARRIRDGHLSPLDLVEQCLGRIERYDAQIRAWVVVDADGARRLAKQLADEGVRGQWRGPLHGIPLGIKDLVDVAGLPTRAGSPLRTDHHAQVDAPLVASLRAAGAIILGKTVTVEFAAFDPPPTRNPWDPSLGHTPGGSSSGSAAAVAMGMCLGAIGTQTGGSLVRPASYCGIATCKPTFGRLSTQGIVPLSVHFDHPGPMARTVDDLELMLRAMTSLGDRPRSAPKQPPRLAVVENFFLERADIAIRAAIETAIEQLRAGGAIVERVRLPVDFAEILDRHLQIMSVDAATYHRQPFAEHRSSYGPMITRLLDDGLKVSAVDYAHSLAHLQAIRREAGLWLDSFDALLAPSTDTTAPARLDTTGPRDFQAPWSYAGLPVVSIPCGLCPDRMPAALQLVGHRNHEATLLAIARWCEERLGFNACPPWED